MTLTTTTTTIKVSLLQSDNETSVTEQLRAPVTFSVPWHRSSFSKDDDSVEYSTNGDVFSDVDTQVLAYWDDGSVKWTAHTLVNVDSSSVYVRKVQHGKRLEQQQQQQQQQQHNGWDITHGDAGELVISNKLGSTYRFYKIHDDAVFAELNGSSCSIIGSSSIKDSHPQDFTSSITGSKIENITKERVVILTTGSLLSGITTNLKEPSSIDFKIRTYLYHETDQFKTEVSIIYKLDSKESLRSLGLEFTKSLQKAPLYDRHIKLTGVQGGILSESAQSITGLWLTSPPEIRTKQAKGEIMPDLSDPSWDWDTTKLAYVPSYDQYFLTQPSSHGFEIHKKFQSGFAKIKCIGGSRNDGCVFIGSPQDGGISIGLSKFWEKYPTGIDVKGFTKDTTKVQVWFYSPSATPNGLDVSPYYDGLVATDYKKQIEGLQVTYEDFEPGFGNAYGISRSFEVFINTSKPNDHIITSKQFKDFSLTVRNPPVMIVDLNYLHKCDVWPFWIPDYKTSNTSPTSKELKLETNLEKLFEYYTKHIDLNDWYGFWDYGDVMHTPDTYRHQWRYDVGGYAWDNSELSTDLWLWMYFLHTGNSKVFRLAEAMTRHTGEVDVYHAGRFQGFGTRHGVQHWSDSSKQLRISNVLFRRFYYYLSGGNERIGELMDELKESQTAMLTLDSHRKVQEQPPSLPKDHAMANIGLDWGSLLGAWMTNWERRTDGWESAKSKLFKSISSLVELPHGFANNAVLMNVITGECKPVPPPTPEWSISHLSTVFGLNESITELIEIVKNVDPQLSTKLIKWWTDYAVSFNGGERVQMEKYGFVFPKANISLQQSHSRCTAHVASLFKNEELGRASWEQFFHTDGYSDEKTSWELSKLNVYDSITGIEGEYDFITTNFTAQYGISAIYLLSKVRQYL